MTTNLLTLSLDILPLKNIAVTLLRLLAYRRATLIPLPPILELQIRITRHINHVSPNNRLEILAKELHTKLIAAKLPSVAYVNQRVHFGREAAVDKERADFRETGRVRSAFEVGDGVVLQDFCWCAAGAEGVGGRGDGVEEFVQGECCGGECIFISFAWSALST